MSKINKYYNLQMPQGLIITWKSLGMKKIGQII